MGESSTGGRDRSSRPFWLGEDARGWDHVRVHVQLLRDDRIGANELAVYMGLVAHAELHTGATQPSVATLGGYAQLSQHPVENALRTLRDLSYIAWTSRKGLPHKYRVLPPPQLPHIHTQDEAELSTSAESADHLGTSPSQPQQNQPRTSAEGADELERERQQERRGEAVNEGQGPVEDMPLVPTKPPEYLDRYRRRPSTDTEEARSA